MYSWLSEIDYHKTSKHYNLRVESHHRIKEYFRNNDTQKYVKLALGISEASGNYSAEEHGLGPRILSESNHSTFFEFAGELFNCKKALDIPEVIYKRRVPHLAIAVGSEMAMMLSPNSFWVVTNRLIIV